MPKPLHPAFRQGFSFVAKFCILHSEISIYSVLIQHRGQWQGKIG